MVFIPNVIEEGVQVRLRFGHRIEDGHFPAGSILTVEHVVKDEIGRTTNFVLKDNESGKRVTVLTNNVEVAGPQLLT